MIYTELYASLVGSGQYESAQAVLKKYASKIDMITVAEKHISDDQVVDDAMLSAFANVFMELEKQHKRSQI